MNFGMTKSKTFPGQWKGEIKNAGKVYTQNLLKSILSKKQTSGDYKNPNIKTNLKDELINAITEKLFFNRYEEITPNIGFGGQFGKEKNWNWGGQLGLNKQGQPSNIGFNIGRSF